jgi:hypothetical protein
MSSLSCKNNCKKTKQLRESSFCTGTFENIGGKIIFGCEKELEKTDLKNQNFLTCNFYDMDIKENCKICPLYCKENLNPKVKKTEDAMKNVSSILGSLGPMAEMTGMDPNVLKKAFSTIDSSKINTNTSSEIEEVVKITNYARDVLSSVMSGRSVDIVEIRRMKEEIEKKYKK